MWRIESFVDRKRNVALFAFALVIGRPHLLKLCLVLHEAVRVLQTTISAAPYVTDLLVLYYFPLHGDISPSG
jgi:hypothetical protein